MRETLKRNGHPFTHLLGRTSDGSARAMFAVNFDEATKARLAKIDPKHTRGVIHVDKAGNATHAHGQKMGKVRKVSEAAARKERNSFRGKDGHFVIR